MKLILLFSLCFIPILSHFCNYDEYIKQNPPKIVDPPFLLRSTSTSNTDYHPIEIHVDYTSIKNEVSDLDDEYVENFKNVIKSAISMLQKLIMVNNISLVKFNTALCNKDFTFVQKINDGIATDLVIIPIFRNNLGKAVASAAACYIDYNTRRPIGGVLNLNIITNFGFNNSLHYAKMTVVHEITHVLGFAANFFEYFQQLRGNVLGTINVNGIGRKILKTPKVVEVARKHYNCSTLEGVELENQGGNGSVYSHWEARIMLGDYMVSTISDEMVISDITLAFLEDTGWYKVNYYTGGLFRFGQGEGCEFLNSKCIINEKAHFKEEFCDKSWESLCMAGYTNKGICSLGKYEKGIDKLYQYFSDPTLGGPLYVDYCPITVAKTVNKTYLPWSCKVGSVLYASEGEVIGDNSICVNTFNKNIPQAMCLPIKCNYTSSTILIEVLGKTITCTEYGENITINSNLTIKCPRYTKICAGSVWCNEPEECINLKSTLIDIENNNKTKVIIIIVCIMTLLIIVGLIIYIYIRRKKDNNRELYNLLE